MTLSGEAGCSRGPRGGFYRRWGGGEWPGGEHRGGVAEVTAALSALTPLKAGARLRGGED
jgi:hypothetical protein